MTFFTRGQTVFGRLVLLMLGLLLASHGLTFLLIDLSLDQAAHSPPPPPHWVWAGLLAQALAAAGAVWVGSRVLARPFERLAQAAASMQADQTLMPLPLEGPTEARRAAELFNAMQARISQQVQQRQALLAGIAHDLRGPLTRMQLRLDQPAEEVDLALLRRDSREMAALLEQSLSLLSGGVAAEACQWLDLRALGDTLVDDLSEQHALPPERLSCHGEVPPIWARPVALRRALSNLLDNAVRHGGGGELCLAHEGSVWRIEVSDRGPGLAAELLEQVLRPYVQAPEAARGGWGLGLAVAHQVAQAHGGTLSLHAREGGGLTVRMTLPSQVCPD
ncbi:sensor histidine kinase [Ideonella sp.]|jgi:signal transduction histidine kinase|uniref:sensor histidine kinase n=1 Tax=Ideonella sp. TaxID=1929293 RepID=UPI0037C0FC89